MLNSIVKYKRYLVLAYDGLAISIAFCWSQYLIHGNLHILVKARENIIIILSTQLLTLILTGVYKGLWRFSSIPDLWQVIKGVSLGVIASLCFLFLWDRALFLPRSVFIIDWFISIVLVGGGRFFYRIWRDFNFNPAGVKTLVYGAGENGEQLLREIQRRPELQLQVTGFIDDNRAKRKMTLRGVTVLGSIFELENIILKENPKRIFVAINSLPSLKMRKIAQICGENKIEVLILPPLAEMMNNKNLMNQVRKVSYEDLLGREAIELDKSSLGKMISEKVILVTGAGGSIGSELCMQIACFNPRQIILYEKTEFFLYQLDQQLQQRFPNIPIVSVMGDILNGDKLSQIFEQYRPHLVFHAAAYKHVPLMELNPDEAILNNVKGTFTLVEKVAKCDSIEKFVLISTDKAVNPTNIMGATKKLAEMICQHFNRHKVSVGNTQFIIVRFGNVLGSSGSVIPLFKQQILAGGPITVTHPEITRYFMSIPEACQLVLEAASIGQGGEVFVLDMGEPIKILELAKQMICLSGLTPEVDIKIEFTGLRPGEKLYEELFSGQEQLLPTKNAKVKIAKYVVDLDQQMDQIVKLISLPLLKKYFKNHGEGIKALVKEIIPEYEYKSIENILEDKKDLSINIIREKEQNLKNNHVDHPGVLAAESILQH